MKILGINAYHGDVAAAVLIDGCLDTALEEERFSRVKHAAGFPTGAIARALSKEGLEVERVAISRDPRANLSRKIAFSLRSRPSARLLADRLRNTAGVVGVSRRLKDVLGEQQLPKVHNVEHHPSHLASAFFMSPFEDAAVCAIDGFGDFVSTSLAVGRGNRIDVLDRVFFPHSLGMLYTAITQYLGFLAYGDEFKVMGLAPYGKPEFVDEIGRLVQLERYGKFALSLRYFRHWSEGVELDWEDGKPTVGIVYSKELERLLGPARSPDEPLTERHEAVARSLQLVYEKCAFHVLRGLWERTRNPRLCLAGGCAMNSVANGKIRAETPFEEVFIQPAAGDNGTALGAALHVWHHVLNKPRMFVMEHAYWGTEYPDADVVTALSSMGQTPAGMEVRLYANAGETCHAVAELLADGNVVGWFQGRMEWGARALGNRSILADPRRADMRDIINTKIKHREKFRPFAPSILEEYIDDYFVGGAPDPFMLNVYPIRPDRRSAIPAVTHVDGSARLQSVSAESNPKYYRLIDEFRRITGIPMLLNTSFNENEPIVDTPEQAMDCFLRTEMDAIVVNDSLLLRGHSLSHRSIETPAI